jgi:hypothetical protein
MLASLTSLASSGAEPVPAGSALAADDRPDGSLADLIVEDIRHGADYYTAAANALRISGYPLRPFVAFRLPTLAVVQSHMSQVAVALLLYALAVITLFAWSQRLGDAFPRFTPRAVATMLAAAGLMSALDADMVARHDVWAGLLVALSLAARRPGRWVTAVALGLSAMLIRETTVLYVAIMTGAAMLDGQRREAAGWIVAIMLFAIVLGVHANAVEAVVRPLDQVSTGWSGMLGFGFAVTSIVRTTALSLAPPALGALAVALALAGWATWRDPLATRALATLLGYVMLLSFFGGPDDRAWGFIVAPIALVGLAFVPDMIRDLARAALDRRRITVTRTAS